MYFKRVSTLVMFASALAACATPTYNYQPLVRDISQPPLDVVSVAAVGDTMVVQGRFVEHDGIRLAQKISVGMLGSYSFLPGEYRKTGDSADGAFYQPTNGLNSGSVSVAALADPFQSIMLKKDGQICGVSTFNAYTCAKATGVEAIKVQSVSANSFQQTLIYSGKVGDKINVGYREFSSDIARPAFNNDVEYDLKDSTTIGYKGALIEVLEATNQSIRYRVIKNFNQAAN